MNIIFIYSEKVKMISGIQIRAARSLLNLKQAQLAQEAKLSTVTLNAVEQETVAPRKQTLEKIESVLRSKGVDFTDGHGVKLQKDVFNITVFEGELALDRYLRDVINVLREQGGVALHSSINELPFIQGGSRKSIYEYYNEFEKYNLREQILICEGVRDIYGHQPYAEYKWMSKELFNQVGYSVYGNKYAIISSDQISRIVVIENAPVAETFRRQFSLNWENAKPAKHRQPIYFQDKQKYR